MAATRVDTLDLNFQGMQGAIASYLIRHGGSAVLIESGPGSTARALQQGLAAHGLGLRDITHVLLTHIHLDHAGAAGWMAQHGAQIVVHPVGAPHLVDPAKLLRSAQRIYGADMDRLWGEVLPVPQANLIIPADGETIRIGDLRFLPVNTPGHAEHHYSYLFEDLCFSGDIGGIRIGGHDYVRVPMPPPELDFEKWSASVRRLKEARFARIAPTHFGIYDDAASHLNRLEAALARLSEWLEVVMAANPEIEHLRREFLSWSAGDEKSQGLNPSAVEAYNLAGPVSMSADGLFRYWHKVRNAPAP